MTLGDIISVLHFVTRISAFVDEIVPKSDKYSELPGG